MNRVLVVVFVVFATAILLGRCRPSGIPSETPYLDWSEPPSQVATNRPPFEVETRRGSVRLSPRAEYHVTGMVIGVERYRFDGSAFLSPLDVALAWGPVPDFAKRISFQQMGRFVHWQTKDMSLDFGVIKSNVANTHTIPATSTVRRAIASLGRREAVRLEGLLVDAEGEDGFRWRTSLTRDDDGDGACELMWVEVVEVGGRRIR